MIEFLDNTTAALRTVATDQPYQQQGFGRQMIKLLENRKLGYSEMEFDDKSITLDIIDLRKFL